MRSEDGQNRALQDGHSGGLSRKAGCQRHGDARSHAEQEGQLSTGPLKRLRHGKVNQQLVGLTQQCSDPVSL